MSHPWYSLYTQHMALRTVWKQASDRGRLLLTVAGKVMQGRKYWSAEGASSLTTFELKLAAAPPVPLLYRQHERAPSGVCGAPGWGSGGWRWPLQLSPGVPSQTGCWRGCPHRPPLGALTLLPAHGPPHAVINLSGVYFQVDFCYCTAELMCMYILYC